jgi:DNA-binding NarL/FixJ family response regulator
MLCRMVGSTTREWPERADRGARLVGDLPYFCCSPVGVILTSCLRLHDLGRLASRRGERMTVALGVPAKGHTVTARLPDGHPHGAVRPVSVSVLCTDPVLAGGANAYLRGCAEVEVATGTSADVLLVFADTVDQAVRDGAEARLAELPAPGRGASPRLVLVVDSMAERHLWWAIEHGLSAVLPRRTTSWDDVVAALVKARRGDADLPSSTVGWLLDQVRALDARLSAVGVNAAGLTERETEILRLFAAGMETADVARELNYSERTIKSVVFAVKERLGLRNRVHVVAHALRIGAI